MRPARSCATLRRQSFFASVPPATGAGEGVPAEDAVVELFQDNRFYGNRLAGLTIDGFIDDSAAADVIAALDEASDYSGGDQPNGLPVVQVDGLNVRDRQLNLPRIQPPRRESRSEFRAAALPRERAEPRHRRDRAVEHRLPRARGGAPARRGRTGRRGAARLPLATGMGAREPHRRLRLVDRHVG